MQHFKRWLYRVVTGVLIVSAVGCSTPPESTGSTQDPTKRIELNVVDHLQIGSAVLDSINDEFIKKHPNVDIRLLDPEQHPLRSVTADGSGKALSGIDVVLFPPNGHKGAALMGALKELPAVKLPPLDEAVAGVFEDLSMFNGKRYVMPFWISTPVMGVNEQHLSKANVPIPPMDWTWSDFEVTASAAMKAGLPIDMYLQELLDPALRAYGGGVYDQGRKAWALDTAESKQGLSMLAGLVQKKVLNPTSGNINSTSYPPDLAFIQYRTKVYNYPGVVLRPFPRGPKGRPAVAAAAVAAVPSTALQSDLAMEYVLDLVTNPNVQTHLAKGRLRPVVANEKVMGAWREAVGSQTALAFDLAMQELYYENDFHLISQMRTVLDGLNPFLSGSAPLDKTVADLLSKLPY